ncbi:hypothetical protein BJ742DRAFT_767676 [Cladochytrium replicatum]|nr:hypothetical protein BJ742DRAFT_767676 [Cladochytrium replicatum]
MAFSKNLHNNVIKPLTKVGVEVLLGAGVDLVPFRSLEGSFQAVVVDHTFGPETVEADLTIVAPGGYKPNLSSSRLIPLESPSSTLGLGKGERNSPGRQS